MALSSSTTTTRSLCIPTTNNILPPYITFQTNLAFPLHFPPGLRIRSFAENSAGATELESQSSIELPKESSSLISTLCAITKADHNGRLDKPRGCPYEMVPVAYNNKVRETESQGLGKDILNKKLELLKESYTIMSSPDERRMYDWSLAREGNTEKFIWPYEVDVPKIPKGDPPPQEPEDVGYFLVGWIVLAFVLSIGLSL